MLRCSFIVFLIVDQVINIQNIFVCILSYNQVTSLLPRDDYNIIGILYAIQLMQFNIGTINIS